MPQVLCTVFAQEPSTTYISTTSFLSTAFSNLPQYIIICALYSIPLKKYSNTTLIFDMYIVQYGGGADNFHKIPLFEYETTVPAIDK